MMTQGGKRGGGKEGRREGGKEGRNNPYPARKFISLLIA
jgi:hypothetical protein